MLQRAGLDQHSTEQPHQYLDPTLTKPLPIFYPNNLQSRQDDIGGLGESQHEKEWYRRPSTVDRGPGPQSPSTSSRASSWTMTTRPSHDHDQARLHSSTKRIANDRPSGDPEKAVEGIGRLDPARRDGDVVSLASSLERGEEDSLQLQEQKALKIILFLSGPCVLLSSLNAVWAFISLFITLLTQPVRLCAKRPSFSQQLAGLLGPALNLQLRCIYTPLPPYADEDGSYNAVMLVVVHLLSPVLALGMMVVAWVVAVYWASSVAVGDPTGTDKQDDGRDTVLSLRRWWEAWMLRAVKEE